jgi:hypothetical protein
MNAAQSAFGRTLHVNVDEHVPLPHFSMSGDFNAKTKSVPSVSVSWYAHGALFNHAAVFGEAGPEYALPLNQRTLQPLANGISGNLAPGGGGNTINMSVQVDGSENPEQFALRLARKLKREMQTI